MEAYKRIKCVRKTTELSQPDFASFIGVKGTQIINIETNKQRTPHEVLEKIAKKFPEFKLWILSGEEYPEIGQISPMTKEVAKKLTGTN